MLFAIIYKQNKKSYPTATNFTKLLGVVFIFDLNVFNIEK
ncbi:hypothetical protein PSM_A0555 [Pseudoalteromonas sp. SM9913]|nr:hypothetical protein PSM_A0555 [Pseudoalteromonas sp. SM9913]